LLGAVANPGNAGGTPNRPADAASPPWKFAIADIHVANGVLHVADESVTPAFRVNLSGVTVDARKIASSGEGTVDLAFDSSTGAHFAAHSDVDLAGKAARGHFSLTTFHLDLLFPYYAEALNLDVRKGTFDLAADFAVAASIDPMQLTLAQGTATLADLDMTVRGERETLWRIPRVDVSGAFDRILSPSSRRIPASAFRLVRQDGINLARPCARAPPRVRRQHRPRRPLRRRSPGGRSWCVSSNSSTLRRTSRIAR
jgi:hypothetical protein